MSIRVLSSTDVDAVVSIEDCIEAVDAAMRQYSERSVVMPVRLDEGAGPRRPPVHAGGAAWRARPRHEDDHDLSGQPHPQRPDPPGPDRRERLRNRDTPGGDRRRAPHRACALPRRPRSLRERWHAWTRSASRSSARACRRDLTSRPCSPSGPSRRSSSARALARRRSASSTRGRPSRMSASPSSTTPARQPAARTSSARCRAPGHRWLVALENVSPGTHINGVGSHGPNDREVDGPTMAAARVAVDSRESALRECGDCILAIQDGLFDESHVIDEVGEVLAGTKAGRTSVDQITVYQSCGLAVQDVADMRVARVRTRLGGRARRRRRSELDVSRLPSSRLYTSDLVRHGMGRRTAGVPATRGALRSALAGVPHPARRLPSWHCKPSTGCPRADAAGTMTQTRW